ncbi:MAG: hypothetical protein ACXWZ7_18960 [Gemmatirosa sp.]
MPPEVVAARLTELDREWDTDRAVELEASLMGLAGLALGAFVRPAFRAMPAVVAGAVLLHATTGVYPLLPIFRRLGLRTAQVIARERYALKALRGDFDGVPPLGTTDAASRVRAALSAVDASGDEGCGGRASVGPSQRRVARAGSPVLRDSSQPSAISPTPPMPRNSQS